MEEERESKPKGRFAGIEGRVVVKGGMVEDKGGNTLGEDRKAMPKSLLTARSIRMEISSINVVMSKDTLNYMKSPKRRLLTRQVWMVKS